MAIIFEERDNIIFDELWDIVPLAAVVKGQPAVVQDVFGFYHNDAAIGEEVCFYYRDRQVMAAKVVGTGEDIKAGEDLYFIVALNAVSPNKSGTYGVDYYWCGWAKKDAAAAESTVLMNFDGTRWDENL